MKTTFLKFATLLFLFLSINFYAQTNISYDTNYLFGNLEVAEASLSDKAISLIISEVDTRNGNDKDGINNIKPHYKIILDVNSLYKLKFPITAKDSIMFSTTSLQQNLKFNLKVDKFVKSSKGKKVDIDAKTLKKKAASKQEKIKLLSERIAKGDMSAMKELEKITNELVSDSENIMNQIDVKEEKEKSTFDLVFIDTKSLVKNDLLVGTIYIKEFNKNAFVAEFSGKFITECLSQKADCKQKTSNLIPQIKTHKEGNVKGVINVSLKKMFDNR